MRALVLPLLFALALHAEHVIQGPMPAQDGETCVVCYGRCDQEDVAYLVDGQRFAVMKKLEAAFLENPDEYIALYKPNSMQFSDGSAQRMEDTYLLFGLFALVAVFFAGFYAHHVVMKRSEGAAVPAGLAKIPSTPMPRTCGACSGENHPSARSCLHCGAALPPGGIPEVERAR
ncbi:MAG: hypothetical protein JNL98_17015 [Bryobacterales bacterium]|nr:hypothetical protein [Bryobacterales bacterium]